MRVSRLVVVPVAFASFAACGGTPTGPSHSVAGAWAGVFTQLECQVTAPPGRPVDSRSCAHNTDGDARFVIEIDGDNRATGNLTLTSSETQAVIVAANLTGTISSSGAVEMENGSLDDSVTAAATLKDALLGSAGTGTVERFSTQTAPEGEYTFRRLYALTLRRLPK